MYWWRTPYILKKTRHNRTHASWSERGNISVSWLGSTSLRYHVPRIPNSILMRPSRNKILWTVKDKGINFSVISRACQMAISSLCQWALSRKILFGDFWRAFTASVASMQTRGIFASHRISNPFIIRERLCDGCLTTQSLVFRLLMRFVQAIQDWHGLFVWDVINVVVLSIQWQVISPIAHVTFLF